MENQIFALNEIETFLKDFLKDYPSYGLDIFEEFETEDKHDSHLYQLLSKEWQKKHASEPFFLDPQISYIQEDFFLQPQENVTMRKNLRYMPLILHAHQFIEINYVLKSADSVMITRSGKQPLNDGDIILCPPNFVHCFDCKKDESIILDFFIRVTTFETTFFQLLNRDNYLSTVFSNALYNSEGNYIMWHCEKDADLKNLVLSSFEEYTGHLKYSEQMLEANIYRFFILLMRHHEQEAVFSIPQVNSTDSLFQSIHNYMLVHCRSVSLTSTATHFGYSERQLIRILKKNTGKGFSELLLDIRMNRAIQLLKNPALTIPQIADMLGYSSVSYFQKQFVKTFSFTADAFQKRVADTNKNYS